MEIYLSNAGQEPIYAQITRQIKQQILSGQLRAGEPLPSIRLLAKDLRISFVAAQNPDLLREEHLKKMESCLQNAVDAARLGGISCEEACETLRLLWEG